jgi:tripartite-type tricarboxylate transporter receptor subunit TctC
MAASIRSLSALAALLALAGATVSAQPYPSKPVRVVIEFAAGGGTDIVGRLVFQKVGEQTSQQFPIENRTGASGMIAAAFVANSSRLRKRGPARSRMARPASAHSSIFP